MQHGQQEVLKYLLITMEQQETMEQPKRQLHIMQNMEHCQVQQEHTQ